MTNFTDKHERRLHIVFSLIMGLCGMYSQEVQSWSFQVPLPSSSSSSSSSSSFRAHDADQSRHFYWGTTVIFPQQVSYSRTDVQLSSTATTTKFQETDNIIDRSTLTLLEHVNLNVPNHDYVVPFYYGLLGCGLDPRTASNLRTPSRDDNDDDDTSSSSLLWANCGASQFHLPYGNPAQILAGHIGLRFKSLEALKQRLQESPKSFHNNNVEYGIDATNSSGREHIRITDHYGNVFVCRAEKSSNKSSMIHNVRQPFIGPDETEQWGEFVATKYGRYETDCQGIDYVEFHCPPGTASRIATFYESVLDATTSVYPLGNIDDNDDDLSIAIIAIGNIDATGRADQSILFRETTRTIPEYDGHHIALYVGESGEDFEQAFRNAQLANVIWCNPRFQDQVNSLAEARQEQQFRFKDIVDMDTGECLLELEHELRSVNHPSWPGQQQQEQQQ